MQGEGFGGLVGGVFGGVYFHLDRDRTGGDRHFRSARSARSDPGRSAVRAVAEALVLIIDTVRRRAAHRLQIEHDALIARVRERNVENQRVSLRRRGVSDRYRRRGVVIGDRAGANRPDGHIPGNYAGDFQGKHFQRLVYRIVNRIHPDKNLGCSSRDANLGSVGARCVEPGGAVVDTVFEVSWGIVFSALRCAVNRSQIQNNGLIARIGQRNSENQWIAFHDRIAATADTPRFTFPAGGNDDMPIVINVYGRDRNHLLRCNGPRYQTFRCSERPGYHIGFKPGSHVAGGIIRVDLDESMAAFRNLARAGRRRGGDCGRVGAGGDCRLDGGHVRTRCLGGSRVEHVRVQHRLCISAQIHVRAIHKLDIHG